ncbi:MAG: hypothetical protein ABWJ42_02595 [Sulfolobales archaeon]
MVEQRFYYKVSLPIDEVKRFLSDPINLSVDIDKSRIIGFTRSTDKNLWFINLKIILFTTTKIPVRVDVEGDSVTYRSLDGDLLFKYDLYKLDDQNTLVEFYVKILGRIASILSSEISLLNTRMIKSFSTAYRDLVIIELNEDSFRESLSLLSRSLGREIKPQEVYARAERVVERVSEIERKISAPEIVTTIPIMGGETESRILQTVSKSISISCRDCMLYDENSGYCIVLMKKIDDPSRPLCNGEKFIKRA